MKVCRHCGNLIEDSERYCPFCGMRYEKTDSIEPTDETHKPRTHFWLGVFIAALIVSALFYSTYITVTN